MPPLDGDGKSLNTVPRSVNDNGSSNIDAAGLFVATRPA